MSDTLYDDALEICLQALEQGADIESCLVRYPYWADELRSLLETAAQAKSTLSIDVPADAMRRSRMRVLQQAAELREQQYRTKLPLSFFGWRSGRFTRLALTALAVLIFLLTGGTGLVSAASSTVPGDNLYPVKRTWENVQLLFVFTPQARVSLEHHLDQERVQEIHTLFAQNRLETVGFQGMVTAQNQGIWQIAGIPVLVDNETHIVGTVSTGAMVQIDGETEDGKIKAEQVLLILAPSQTPTFVPTLRPEDTLTPASTPTITHNSESESESTSIGSTQAAQPDSNSSDGAKESGNNHSGDNESGDQ